MDVVLPHVTLKIGLLAEAVVTERALEGREYLNRQFLLSCVDKFLGFPQIFCSIFLTDLVWLLLVVDVPHVPLEIGRDGE